MLTSTLQATILHVALLSIKEPNERLPHLTTPSFSSDAYMYLDCGVARMKGPPDAVIWIPSIIGRDSGLSLSPLGCPAPPWFHTTARLFITRLN
jgi:hypothetical protein